MPGESISIDLNANDRASRQIKDVGRAAADTAVKVDLAAASLKLYNDTAAKSVKADSTLIASKKASAKANALYADATRVLNGEATKTVKLMADQGRAVDDAGKKAEAAAAGFTSAAGNGTIPGGGIGALIG